MRMHEMYTYILYIITYIIHEYVLYTVSIILFSKMLLGIGDGDTKRQRNFESGSMQIENFYFNSSCKYI